MSAFSPERLAYLQEHINDSRVSEIHWVYSVPIVAATISTSLRLWAKRAGRNGITLDDYFIVAATICLIGECASGLGYGPPHGMGRHVIAVAPDDLTMVRKGDYVFSHFYDIALVTVKLGILTFYYRVFVVPLFRKVVVLTSIFVICWGIGITVTLLVVCRPLAAFWDSNVTGTCLDLVKFTYFTNITNLITDFWIFVIPIPVIWHLQLQTKKKLLLCLIFSIGLATCIVSSIRLTVVLGHGDPDFTWSYVPLGAYSVFEPLGGILSTNLPIIWHMWRKRGPLLPGSSAFKSAKSSTTPGSGASHPSRLARSLGFAQTDQTDDSQSRTILGNEEEGTGGLKDSSVVVARSGDAQVWERVERIHSNLSGEGSSERGGGKSESKSPEEENEKAGAAKMGKSAQGMRKNVWEVRKK